MATTKRLALHKLPLPWKPVNRPPSYKRVVERAKIRVKWLIEKKGILHRSLYRRGLWGFRFATEARHFETDNHPLPHLILNEKSHKHYLHLNLSIVNAPTHEKLPVRRYYIDKHGRFDEERLIVEIEQMLDRCGRIRDQIKHEGIWRETAIRVRTEPIKALGEMPGGVKVDLQDDLSYLLGVTRVVTIDQAEELVAMVRRWEELDIAPSRV